MRKSTFVNYLISVFVATALGACRTAAPRLNYTELARAGKALGLFIGLHDNHRLYTAAAQWIGTPYRSGGNTRQGVDCSGLTRALYQTVYRQTLPRTTAAQQATSRRVPRHKLREGDLVFFSSTRSPKKVAHVGIYLKDGKFVHASTSRGVIVSSLDEAYYRQHWLSGGRPR